MTSFYHPTLPDWENTNPEPPVLFRAPDDENLRSALVDALDLSQSLCTNVGHERLLDCYAAATAALSRHSPTRLLA